MLKSQCRSRPFASRLFSSIPREIRGVIVTETRIGNYKSCVRVWDTSGQRFWRPLQDIHGLKCWNRGQWKVGQTVLIKDGIPSDTKFPHATEDIYGHVTAQVSLCLII
jgi:hypothetical protein